jgi:ElaB/YqjD/DUF883 family membrane-anchored ribosome-binding protein
MTQQDTAATDALAAELRRIVEQAEELLGDAGDSAALGELKDRVNHTIGAARNKLADLEQDARQRGRRAAAATESWVRANPWATLAIGAGIGLIVGALLMRGSPAPAPEYPETETGV